MTEYLQLFFHGYRLRFFAPPDAARVLRAQMLPMMVAYREPEPGQTYQEVTVSVSTDGSAERFAALARGLEPGAERLSFVIGDVTGAAHTWSGPQRSLMVVPGRHAIALDRGRRCIDVHMVTERGAAGRSRTLVTARAFYHPLLREWLAMRGVLGIHAGGVAGAHGGLVVTGDSGAGKSTTCLSFAKRGYGFLGDDCLLADPRQAALRIRSFAKPAKVDGRSVGFLPELAPITADPDCRVFDKVTATVEYALDPQQHLQAQVLHAAPASAVLFLEQGPPDCPPVVSALPRVQALARLLSASQREPTVAREHARIDTLTRLATQARCLRCRYPVGKLLDVGIVERALGWQAAP